MNDGVQLSGKFWVKLIGADGQVKDITPVNNTIVTAGKTFLAEWLAAASQAGPFMPYVALGTGTTAATAADTALESELHRKAAALSAAANVWQAQVTFNAGEATGAVTEAGIFSAAAAGTMLARQVFSVKNKTANDVIQVTWQVTFA